MHKSLVAIDLLINAAYFMVHQKTTAQTKAQLIAIELSEMHA